MLARWDPFLDLKAVEEFDLPAGPALANRACSRNALVLALEQAKPRTIEVRSK